MKKITRLVSAALLATLMTEPLRAGSDWETLPVAPRDDEASEWWANTWHDGDVVSMVSRYQFEGRLCIRKKYLKEVRWYEFAKRHLETEQAVNICGVAHCTTSVLFTPPEHAGNNSSEEVPATQLLRSFHSCPISARAVGTIGLRNGLETEKKMRKALDHFYQELQSPEAQEAMDTAIDFGAKMAGLAAAGAVLTAAGAEVAAGGAAAPVTGGTSLVAGMSAAAITTAKAEAARRLTQLAVQWVGRKSKEIINGKVNKISVENQKVLEGARFESYGDSDIRGAEMKNDGWFYRQLPKSEADDLANMATTVNSLFDNGRFYLAAAPGETMLAKQLIDSDGTDGEAFRTFGNALTNLFALPDIMRNIPLTPTDYRVSNIFARETLNVNATLFDLRKRQLGDVWRADASLLNNFLHPDLEGNFEGIIFLKYAGDENQTLVSFPEAKHKVFKTRRLVMLPRHMGMQSRLTYRETGFLMDYDPDTQDTAVTVWTDRETGHIIKVEVRVDGNVAALPNLALFKGFSLYDSTGRLHFEMSAEANPMRKLPDIPKVQVN